MQVLHHYSHSDHPVFMEGPLCAVCTGRWRQIQALPAQLAFYIHCSTCSSSWQLSKPPIYPKVSFLFMLSPPVNIFLSQSAITSCHLSCKEDFRTEKAFLRLTFQNLPMLRSSVSSCSALRQATQWSVKPSERPALEGTGETATHCLQGVHASSEK